MIIAQQNSSFQQHIFRQVAIYTFFLGCLMGFLGMGQRVLAQNEYKAYFEEAYRTYPTVPRGLLEAVAYTQTRMKHVVHQESCQGLPQYFSVMGLVADGKDYFENSLQRVAERSPYTEEEIIESPRIAILAYAAAYASEQKNKRMTTRNVEGHKSILSSLSEIPEDGSIQSQYAKDQQFYCVLKEMESPHTTAFKSRRLFNYESIFGRENLKVLESPEVTVSKQGIRSVEGQRFSVPGVRSANCTQTKSKADYKGAIWNPAHKNNYGSRGGKEVEFITIHTIQGSYASAIAWFRNRNARVSAHYIIRALDGQVTQMVCEDDKAFHVKTDNASAIGIEHEGYIEDGAAWYTNEMYESSARLVRDIAKRRNINPLQTFGGPPTNGVSVLGNKCWKIKGHQHFRGNNHIDPGPFWDWDRYYQLINEAPKPQVFTKKNGEVFDSGNSSGNYGDQERSVYLIKPKNASSINLSFKSFDLEGTNAKPYDYLDVYDGENTNGKFLGRFTGNVLPPELIIKSGAAYLEFRSDCQINKKGWHLQYSARQKNPSCPAPQNLIAKNIFPMGGTLSWESDKKADTYLVYLKRKLENTWTLYRTRRNFVAVTGLSANAFYQWQVIAMCEGDSSATIGANFITPNVGRGQNPQIYNARLNKGKFNDSGGKLAGYGNSENYLFRIIPPDKGTVELLFSSFDTEENHDVMQIYDGLSPQSRLIGTYSGNKVPGPIRSSGNGLSILFKSDKRSTGKGWLASWTSLGGNANPGTDEPQPPITDNGNAGNGGIADNGNIDSGNTDSDPGNGSTDNGSPDPPATDNGNAQPPKPQNPVIVDNSNFDPDLSYHTAAPRSTPELKASYDKSFPLRFEDKDRSGRGLANRFFTIAEEQNGSFRSNPESGFFNETFDQGLHSAWKKISGTWTVQDGILNQTDREPSNTNLYTRLRQSRQDVYVYTWKSKMTGPGNNLRHGLHFFADKPRNPDRGTSYFVWIRDGGSKDYVEIYKTVNDQFDRKIRKEVRLKKGKVYDYKVIFNPKKGRIEVYVDNRFTASWVDRYPLSKGDYISLRSGNCIVSYDDIRVYKSRGPSVNVSVDKGARSMLEGNGRFKVYSLIVDRNIRWSREVSMVSQIGEANFSDNNDNTSTDLPSNTRPPETPAPTPVPGSPSINYQLPHPATGMTFFLPVDKRVGTWAANEKLGFFHEDFEGNALSRDWTRVKGSWSQANGVLSQTDTKESNGNIYMPVLQKGSNAYLYHFRARILTEGDNKRFGLHFMNSNGLLQNRGNSFLLWFRHHSNKGDKVEVYKANNDNMTGPRKSALLPQQIQPRKWYDFKIMYNPQEGTISSYMNNQHVLTWAYEKPEFLTGSSISLRVGNSEIQFDDLRVYQLAPATQLSLSKGSEGMIQANSRGLTEAKVLSIHFNPNSRGIWSAVREEVLKVE